MRKLMIWLFACVVMSAPAFAQISERPQTLAALLATTSVVAGQAPTDFDTPFFIARVTPIESGNCSLIAVTNGMAYSIFGSRDAGWCNNLPSLHSLVWGRVRHSKLGSFLRQSNTADVASEYVDLVYANGHKPKVSHYIISTAEAIGPDWGK